MAETALPPMSEHGYVLLPDGAVKWGQSVNVGKIGRRSSHHLYWPNKAYGQAGSVSRTFREHPVNKVTLPRVPHARYHDTYDLTVVEQPELIRPTEDMMGYYLDDLRLFDSLRNTIGSIRSIDSDLRQGTYAEPTDVGLERRAAFAAEVLALSTAALNTELVPHELIEYAVFNTMARFDEAPPQARVA